MNLTLIRKVAVRYYKGKGTANAVPILARISMVAIGVCSAAMIILFSVFNGFEGLVKDSYKSFYPDIKITPLKGKFFSVEEDKLKLIEKIKGVELVAKVIEDNVLAKEDNLGGSAKGDDNQLVITLKGIDDNYFKVNDIHEHLLNKVDSVSSTNPYTAIVGERILKQLGVDMNDNFSYILFYYLDPTVTNPETAPGSAFQTLRLHPAGGFSVLEEFDNRYIFASLNLVQQLFHSDGKYSSVEIKANNSQIPIIKSEIDKILNHRYAVETRYEQNKTMYMVMNTEKWAAYFILLMVLLIASFNMIGALSMLVLEKRKDVVILKAMGASSDTILTLFLLEGLLWAFTGGLLGLVLGVVICLAQQQFNIIKLGGSFLVDAYPVKIQVMDILLVLSTIVAVGLLTSWVPATRANGATDPSLKTS